ncbi:unnamed protein product [Linum trigynum]|uniref:RNase H type-1 domain-containing protein n=1 Tax=Linum trigynum TaxID=586398 RepID=A0AAV2FLP0_9ROSI
MDSLVGRGENLTSEEWFCELQETESEDQLGSLLVALWYLWDQRNCHLWNKNKLEEWEILPRASEWLHDYLTKQMKSQSEPREEEQRWKHPTAGSVKLNVDAACFDGQGTRWGVVARDQNGQFLFGAVKRSQTQWNPEEAEVLAVDFGLEMARRIGMGEVEMESDCQGIIQQLRREERRETEVGLMCEEIRIKALALVRVCWSWVGRNKNKSAHKMAHLECNWDSEEVWDNNPPQILVPLLREDATENFAPID